MCVTIVAANLNISQAVKAAETVQDNKIKSGDIEPTKYSGSCRDTTTWIENKEDNDINSIAYFVKNDNRRFLNSDNPQTAGEKYYKIICNSIDRVNYKDANGNLLRINNQFIQSVISREIEDIKEEVINGKLEKKESKKTITDTYYINTGNDYVAKFPTNPNQGFYFKTSKFYDGTVFEVVKVTIGSKELASNTPIIKGNILTYPEVLPGVDLKYILNTNGIAKYFEIKNADAIKQNDLTSFAFDLADNTKLEKKDEKKDKLQAILESKGITNESSPTITKAKEGIELVKETKQVIETKTIPVQNPAIITPIVPTIPIISPVPAVPNQSSSLIPTSQINSPSSQSSVSISTSSKSSVSSVPSTPSIVPPAVVEPLKTETKTVTQNKSEIEINAIKEDVKTNIVKELDIKIVKLEEIKKEEESKGDKKDNSLIEITNKTIESTKSLTNEVKSNTINVADEKQISIALKGSENNSSGSEKLNLINDEKLIIGLPIVFDQNINNTKTIASTISLASDKLTITLDKSYLDSKDRKFPIFVDPDFQTRTEFNEGIDSFVNTTNYDSTNGVWHKQIIGFGNPVSDNTTGAVYGYSEGLLGFGIGTRSKEIVSGKLGINLFQTRPGNLRVTQTDEFNENTVTYRNKPNLGAEVGMGSFGNIQINWPNKPENVNVDLNFSNIDRSKITNNKIYLGLQSSGYAFACSKDRVDGPCSISAELSPYLEVMYTNNPTSPSSNNFNTGNFVGQCDQSKPEGQKGNCDVVSQRNLGFNDVNSGETNNSEASKTKILRSNKTGMTISQEDENIQSIYSETGYSNINKRQDSANVNVGSGVYKNVYFNEDQYNKISDKKVEYFQNDNGSPVAYSGIKTEGSKAKDGSYLIGRSNPENTQPQVSFTVPDYMDATYNKFSVTPSWDSTLILDIAGGFNPVDFSGVNQGKAIQFLKEKKYNLDAQVFTQDGTVIRANNSDFCWDENQGDNNRLVIAKCTGNDNQKFTYDPSTKQFKLLDQGFDFGNISSISNPSRTLNIWGGNNDNQTRIKMAEKSSSWNTQFRYNRITKEITNQLGKCFDAGNNKNGEDLRIHDCNGGNQQKFNLDAKNRIVNYASRLCVDSYSGDAIGSRQYMGTCHEGMNQKFKVEIISSDQKKEITIANAKNCVDGSSGYTALYVKPCSDSIYQKFDYSTEDIVRITAPGGKYGNGFSFNSATLNANGGENANGIPELSYLYTNSTSMQWQSLRYSKATKKIRTNENLCLWMDVYNELKISFYKQCGNASNNMWEEDVIGGVKSIVSIYKQNGNKVCLTSDKVYGGDARIYGSECTGTSNQEFGFENFQKYLFTNNEMKYQARISESQDGATGASIVIPWQTSPVFQFNSDQNLSEAFKAINNNTYNLKLEDGKSYFVSIQAKDRNTDVANISAWSQPSRIVIDTSLPTVSDLKTVIKGNDKSINFNVLEKNFASAYIQIYDINNQPVKKITNCNGALCENLDASTIKNLSFTLDGLNDAGKELSDGNYRIEPVVIDKSKNQNANSTQVGGTNTMEADVNGAVSKSANILMISNSATIYIVNPINNGWTNKDTIKIEGSSGRVNSTDANGVSITKGIKQLDFAKLDLDGAGAISNGTALEVLPFNFFNNFTKEVKLDYGKNEFKLTSTDTNDAKNNKIGDPAKERVESWVINREDIAPEIKSIKFNGNISIPTSIPTINDSKANIEFTAMDNTDPNYSSGINTGINPKGYDISLLRSIDDNASFREIPLFKDGVNISDPNPNPRLAGDLKCDPVGLEVKCSFVADNLKLDANYILHLKVNDRAGNQVCTRHYEYVEKALSDDLKCKSIKPSVANIPYYTSSPTRDYTGYDLFKIKTFTYLNTTNNTDYEVLPGLPANIPGGTTTQTFTGLKSASYSFDVEENAYLVFRNSSSKRMMFIDPKFPTFPLETDNSDAFPNFATAKNYYRQPDATLTNVTSVCGTSINHDLILETPNIKTCKVTFFSCDEYQAYPNCSNLG
jgi:Ricin-type beta-trefoil lectin domain